MPSRRIFNRQSYPLALVLSSRRTTRRSRPRTLSSRDATVRTKGPSAILTSRRSARMRSRMATRAFYSVINLPLQSIKPFTNCQEVLLG